MKIKKRRLNWKTLKCGTTAVLVNVCLLAVGQPNSPLVLYGANLNGTTYQRLSLYADTQYGVLFEAPLDASNNRMNYTFNWRGGGPTALFINGSNYFVGIGTTSPSSPLEVKGAGIWNGTIRANSTGGYSSFALLENNALRWAIYNHPTIANTLLFANSSGQDKLAISQDGKVGVGLINPAAMLDIQSNVDRKGIRLQGGEPYGTYYLDLSSYGNATNGVGYSWTLKTAGGSWPDLMSLYNGSVGIGNAFPTAKLDVTGGIKVSDPTGGGFNLIVNNGFGGYFNSTQEYSYIAKFRGNTVNGAYDAMVVTGGYDGGKVGIGTNAPDEKLTVKGRIHTQEVKVDLAGAVTPDYVFEKDYNLLSLEELEFYVNTNKHLPEVPSAQEMESAGMNLKEMNLILLKKVEELTLHLIETKKYAIDLEKRIEQIEKQK